MRKSITVMGALAFLALAVPILGQSDYYSYSYARLSYVQGDVVIQRSHDLGYEEGVVNLALVEGDKLGTNDGRAEIHFGRKNYLRIDGNSQLDLITLPTQGYDVVKLHLLSGSVFLKVNFMEMEKDFELHTPDASFFILEEGLYRFDVLENRETQAYCLEGALEAAGEEGSLLVEAGEVLIAENGYLSEGYGSNYGYNDSGFARWNRSRDEQNYRYSGRQYLPDELYEYEAELASYGRWVYESSYGYVWVPRVSHVSWRPYYNGRWVWYNSLGWNWVSYDPWGWSVHHYGRWHWRFGLGWYWIPTRHWGPAWVHWYSGNNYVGWSPLSYYNYPVVIANNRFYGRYNQRYYPAYSRALTVVHKNQLRNRHISRVALNQNGISRLGKISLSSRQPAYRAMANGDGVRSRAAERVLSRSNIRGVGKSYSSGRTIRGQTSRTRVTGTINKTGSSTARSRLSGISKGVSQRRSGTSSRIRGRTSTSSASSRSTVSSRRYSNSRTTNTRSATRGRIGTKAAPKARTVNKTNTASKSRSSKASSSSSAKKKSTRSTVKKYDSSRTMTRTSARTSAGNARLRSSSSLSRSRNTSTRTKEYRSRSALRSRSPTRSSSQSRQVPRTSSSRLSSSARTNRSSSAASPSRSRSSSSSRRLTSRTLTRSSSSRTVKSSTPRTPSRTSPSRSVTSRNYKAPSRSRATRSSRSSYKAPSRSSSSRSVTSSRRAASSRSSPSVSRSSSRSRSSSSRSAAQSRSRSSSRSQSRVKKK